MKKLGFENYEITETGTVVNITTGRVLKIDVTNCGYARVTLSNKGLTKRFSVHRLIAELFIPNPENLPQVNHKDGNKLNNTVSNLEWTDQSNNQKHAVQLGLQSNKRGWEDYRAKLSEVQVKEIKAMYVKGKITHHEIAKLYGVARQTITDLLAGRIYKL